SRDRDLGEVEESGADRSEEDEERELDDRPFLPAEPLARPVEDGQARGRDQQRLLDQEDPRVVPDPIAGCEDDEDRVEMVSEEVRDALEDRKSTRLNSSH